MAIAANLLDKARPYTREAKRLAATKPLLAGHAQAIAFLDRSVAEICRAAPDTALVLQTHKAHLLNKIGRYNEAIALCQHVLSVRPVGIATLETLLTAYTATSRLEEAQKIWERICQVEPERRFRQVKTKEKKTKRKIVTKPATIKEAHGAFATSLANSDYNTAAEQLIFACNHLNLSPNETIALVGTAFTPSIRDRSNSTRGKDELLFRSVTEVLEKRHLSSPDDVGCMCALSCAYMHLGEESKALHLFHRVNAIDPDNAFALYSLAVKCPKGSQEKRSMFTKLQNADPSNINYASILGTDYLSTKEYKPAIEVLRAAHQHRPANGTILNLLVAGYLYDGQFAQADKIIDGAPKTRNTAMLKMRSEFWQGKYNDARASAIAVLESGFDNFSASIALAMIRSDQERSERFIAYLRRNGIKEQQLTGMQRKARDLQNNKRTVLDGLVNIPPDPYIRTSSIHDGISTERLSTG